MDRTQKAIRNHYIKGLHDFTHEQLAPPTTVVTSGELLPVEAISELMTLHEDCIGRVRKQVAGFDARLAKLGHDAVVAPLLVELATFYGVRLDDLHEAFALRDDPDAVYERSSQPRATDGSLDMTVLGPEVDAEFERYGWGERAGAVEAYATPYDPRLPLVRSQVALRPEGIAWVSCPRPRTFRWRASTALRLVHQQSNQWCLEFTDWRRRRLAVRRDPAGWETFLAQLRDLATAAGFTWDSPTSGRPRQPTDPVVYDLAGWSTEARQGLSASLESSGIPHRWEDAELHVTVEHEAEVDRRIDTA